MNILFGDKGMWSALLAGGDATVADKKVERNVLEI